MKNLILFITILFSGIVSAQTFDFNCESDDLDIFADLHTIQDLDGVEVDQAFFPWDQEPSPQYYFNSGEARDLGFITSSEAVRAAEFISNNTRTKDETIAYIAGHVDVLEQGGLTESDIRYYLLSISDNIYYLLTLEGNVGVQNTLSSSLECRLSNLRDTYVYIDSPLFIMNPFEGTNYVYFERTVSLLGNIEGCLPPAPMVDNLIIVGEVSITFDFVNQDPVIFNYDDDEDGYLLVGNSSNLIYYSPEVTVNRYNLVYGSNDVWYDTEDEILAGLKQILGY